MQGLAVSGFGSVPRLPGARFGRTPETESRADLYGTPPGAAAPGQLIDYDKQEQDIERRRRLAQALQRHAQSQYGQPQTLVGGLAALGSQFMAARMERKADRDLQALQINRRGRISESTMPVIRPGARSA